MPAEEEFLAYRNTCIIICLYKTFSSQLKNSFLAWAVIKSLHAMSSLDAEIKSLIKAHSPYFEALDNGKVKCTLNGHEFAPRKDVIEAFVKYVFTSCMQ